MKTVEEKINEAQLMLEKLELKILRTVWEKENEEKRSFAHTN